MSGTINLSLAQRFNQYGEPLAGGKLYFFAAGTTTPQSAYQDSALAIPHANPIVLDSIGNIPQFFLADGQIKIRLTDSAGIVQLAADSILVIGASSGGGGGGSVDATTVLTTGDFKFRYGTGALSGFVRANGRSIGSVTSGATERANADTQALFEYLWTADANLSVSTGRGASAAADFAANKNIALPDGRGRAVVGLDDMGATAAGRLTSTYFGTDATVLGAAGGSERHILTTAQLAAHSHVNTLNDPGHTHGVNTSIDLVDGGANNIRTLSNATTPTAGFVVTGATGITITNASAGSDAGHNNVQPSLAVTMYMKL